MSQPPFNIVTDWPQQIEIIENEWIKLPDGERLAARLWLPKGAVNNPVPAIIEYIPYRKRDLTRERDTINYPYLAAHGYACVRVDLRGSGDSDGILRDQYLEQEQADGVAAIQWIADQPWCNGKVGMLGISWGGFNALQIAARQPPALKAIIAACATDDLYADNMHYMGGCLLADNLSESTVMFAFNSCPPDPEIAGPRWRDMWLQRMEESGIWLDIWLRHQRRNDFWKAGSVCESYSRIQCPVFAISGWADGYTNAVFRLLEHLQVPRKGLVGPWGHKYPHLGIPGPAIGFLQEVRRWFDHWLKGVDTGIMDEPMLRCWMQGSVPPTPLHTSRSGYWVAEPFWPAANVEWQTWPVERNRLLAPGSVSGENGSEAIASLQSPLVLGYFAGKWCSYAAAPDLPDDQRQEDGGALIFDSPELNEPIEILGAAVVEVCFAVDQPVAQIAARLSDIQPDGSATRVTFGLLNLTHRNSNETPEYLEPGHWYTARVQLNNIAQIFPRGHRIRLALSTSYWPLAWPSPKPVKLELDLRKCHLQLPVRDPQPEDCGLRLFDPPEGAPPLETTLIQPGKHNWYVHRDLAESLSELEVINDRGTQLIHETEAEIESATFEWYRSRDNDYGSVSGETRTVRGFKRGDWRTRVLTRTRLTSDETNFYLQAELDAYESNKRIFSKNWDKIIPRDHL